MANANDNSVSVIDIRNRKVVETLNETPKLPAAVPYQPKDNTVEVELSEYAGYAGFIAANAAGVLGSSGCMLGP